jgi:GTP-binding protein HflX
VPREQVVTPEIARYLADLSAQLGRQVGIIVDRKGQVEYVVVGDAHSLELPDLGRVRKSHARLCGVRLIHTHLKGEPLSSDDLSELTLRSLDFIVSVDASPEANPLTVCAAHLLPVNPEGRQWDLYGPVPVHELDLPFHEFMHELEAEFVRKAQALQSSGKADRAVLVYLDDGRSQDPQWEVEELTQLALSADLQILEVVVQRRKPDPKFFIGKGRLFDILARTMQREADLLVFCPDLTPAQVKSISALADIRVIDRTQLILDIFAQRAFSNDGKLQVELAQLRYLLPRFIGAGAAMSRLAGGVGARRGPGEPKLEMDRRKVRHRITALEKRLEDLSVQRRQRRRKRERSRLPIVSIVGYTNAGKSSLLNALTHADALVQNKLFATLDPFSKRLRFPRDREVVLTDTVGFIHDLPRDLKVAFRATLEELEGADLLLHVVDASSPRCDEQLGAVEKLLEELDLSAIPRLNVLNKADLLGDNGVAENLARRYGGVAVSALSRDSLRPLVSRMAELLWSPTSGADFGDRNGPEETTGATDEGSCDEEELRA